MLIIMWMWKLRWFQAIKDDILDRCKIRATFAPPTFEDKERLQAHCSGIEICLRGTISIKSARERSPVRKQIRIPPQPAWPKGYKHTAMAWWLASVVQSLSRAQERDHPCGNKSECHRGTPGLFNCWIDSIGDKLFAILKSLIILSILDGSGHIYMGFVLKWFIRIRTHVIL